MIRTPRCDARRRPRALVLALALVAVGLLLGACGGTGADPGSENPESRATDYDAALADAPPALERLYARANELIPGGPEAYERQLRELRGYPVVVNKWASWCGPCRFEFPFLQELSAELGTEIAFLGINSNDSEDAAQTFLEGFPVPYPSFIDGDHEIGDLLENAREFPVTAFYDADGELVSVHRGVYSSKDALEADIDRNLR